MSTEPSSLRYPLVPVTPSASYDFHDHAETFSTEMALIHNVLIRCLNSIWHHAPLIRKEDEEAFLGYCLVWVKMIHGHHHAEETIVFPFVQAKFDMAANVDQHKAFLGPFEELETYLKSVAAKTVGYDGPKVRALVEAFGDTFVEHLHEEIPTISPERLKQFDVKALNGMISVHEKYVKSHSLVTDMVLVITHHDFSQVPNWVGLIRIKQRFHRVNETEDNATGLLDDLIEQVFSDGQLDHSVLRCNIQKST